MASETMGQYCARLERENTDKQARINRAVRDLDHIAYLAGHGPLHEFVLKAQDRLRG